MKAKRGGTSTITSLGLTEINRALSSIETRLSQVEGIGQNSNLHGSKQVGVALGSRSGETITADYSISEMSDTTKGGAKTGNSTCVQDGALEIRLPEVSGLQVYSGASLRGLALLCGNGLQLSTSGVSVKQQAAVSDVASVSTLTLDAGTDQVNRSAFNALLLTLVSEVNAIRSKINEVISALEAAEILQS